MRETLAERNARYIREGRTVSGGDGNGPGKPGYKFMVLGADFLTMEASLNILADQGYRVEFATATYLLLANYDKKES